VERDRPVVKLLHVSLTARDADRLSLFYRTVFGLVEKRPPKMLHGDAVGRGNGLAGIGIYSIWLQLPNEDGPFLEIMQYSTTTHRPLPAVNEPGFGHLSLSVSNLETTLRCVLDQGGSMQGQITNFGTQDHPLFIVYVRDCEGNILELEQIAEASL
jgi:predicted enzyme related to lactoylglutathione lyase